MIETISSTGARHLTLPGSRPARTEGQRKERVIVAALLIVVLCSAFVAGGLLLRRQGWSGSSVTGEASTALQPAVALPDLPPPDALRPLSPEEALKANADRPLDAVAATPAAPFKLRADQISRLRAVDCLTQAIYYEAASEGVDGGRAVAQVVLNRMRHPGYPNSVCGVVYQGSERTTGCQFTFTCDGSLARTPVGYLWARSRLIATEALAGRIFPDVGYSTHYHADYVVPYWAASLDKVAVVGRHIFYRLRGANGTRSAFRQGYAGQEAAPPLPSPEVITDGLDTLENATAPITPPLEPKVEEDRIEAIAPDTKVVKDETGTLAADLTRGQLILGEAPAKAAKPKPKNEPEDGCGVGSTPSVARVGKTIDRVGAAQSAC